MRRNHGICWFGRLESPDASCPSPWPHPRCPDQRAGIRRTAPELQYAKLAGITVDDLSFHFKATVGFGKRDADTQRIFDTMAARQAGLDPKMVRRTGDGCLEVFVQNPDGSYENKYFDPDTMKLVFD